MMKSSLGTKQKHLQKSDNL